MTLEIGIKSVDDMLTVVHRVVCLCGWSTEHDQDYYDLTELTPATHRAVDHILATHETRDVAEILVESFYHREEQPLIAMVGERHCCCADRINSAYGAGAAFPCVRRPETPDGLCAACARTDRTAGHGLTLHDSQEMVGLGPGDTP